MSTPIEIVREQMHAERARYNYCATSAGAEYYTALASVLRDAERFNALERAFEKHGNEGMITVMRWKGQRVWHYTKEPEIDGATLAELADRLREGAT